MIISAHQPAFMPWLGYLHKILVSDKFVILDNVQFEKNSFINRNYIMGHDGPILLTVPIKIKNHLSNTIKDIEISNEINWKKKHLNSIYLNYKKSPFFKEHFPFFEEIYNNNWSNLFHLNHTILDYLMKVIEIDTKIIFMSDLKVNGVKSELIIDLCKKLGAEQFVFGSNGRDYADIKSANQNNIQFLFQDYSDSRLPYRIYKSEKNLSSIDILFNLKHSSIKKHILRNGKILN
jgi:hypothetical protein